MEWAWNIVLGSIAVVGLMRMFSSKIYDVIIIKMTKKWYHAVLSRLEKNARVLDVGIGTGTALLENKDLVLEKNLTFVGVDYDQAYIKFADKQMKANGLQDKVKVFCKSIYDQDLGAVIKKDKEDVFDHAYFSGSWTLMPDPVAALRVAASFVKDDGKVYVTQTFQRQATPFLGIIKPLLKYITTIDFGPLHYESDLETYIKGAAEPVDGVKLVVEENGVVPGSIDHRFQAARLIVFKKQKA